jgi:hypothetical protein
MHRKGWSVVFALAGVAGLLLRGRYQGPLRDGVHSYAGNVCVSFAVYFILTNLPVAERFRRSAAFILALAAVELFEAFDGYGLMQNTFDPWDYLANAAGAGLALGIDLILLAPREVREVSSVRPSVDPRA